MEYFARKDFFLLFVFNILRRGLGEGAVEAAGLSPPKESRCKSGLQPRRGNSANRSPIPVAKAEGPDGAIFAGLKPGASTGEQPAQKARTETRTPTLQDRAC